MILIWKLSDEYDQHFERLVNNKAQDETRCFEIVRRVLDEETVLEMVSTFLMLTQEHRVPSTARIDFHSCNFDPISGVLFNWRVQYQKEKIEWNFETLSNWIVKRNYKNLIIDNWCFHSVVFSIYWNILYWPLSSNDFTFQDFLSWRLISITTSCHG